MQLNDQNWSVAVICKHRFRRSFRGAYGLIYVYFSFDKWAKCFIQIGVQKVIKEFTEAQKFISTSKGFSSRLDENFSALILLFPVSKI